MTVQYSVFSCICTFKPDIDFTPKNKEHKFYKLKNDSRVQT